jgi:hypothetical protein
MCDVLVESAVADSRTRYQLARALTQLGTGGPPLGAVQASLQTSGARLLADALPGVADQWARLLGDQGVAVRVQPAAPEPRTAGADLRPWLVKGGVAAAVLAVLGGTGWLLSSLVPAVKIGPRKASASRVSPPPSSADIAQRALPSTVAVTCASSIGSGFFVGPGRVLTNAHVLCGGDETPTIHLSDGREAPAQVLRKDERLDLALLAVDGVAAPALPLGDAGALRVGDRIMVVGAPKGLSFSVTQGGVSNLERIEMGVALVQIDAPVNPGNSGGPLLDDRGRVVGVVSLKRMDAEGVAFALPINYAFTGTEAMLPGAGAPSDGFRQIADRADEQDRHEAEHLSQTGQRPGLVGAEMSGPVLIATILWPAPMDPGMHTFYFEVAKDGRNCSLTAEVSHWQKAQTRDGGSIIKPRAKAWLEQHGFASDMYAGVAPIDMTPCREFVATGATLHMRDADDDADSLQFGSGSGE